MFGGVCVTGGKFRPTNSLTLSICDKHNVVVDQVLLKSWKWLETGGYSTEKIIDEFSKNLSAGAADRKLGLCALTALTRRLHFSAGCATV